AVSHGNSPGSWNISATLPPTLIWPAVGLSRPATRDSSVDLPQPDAPIRQLNSPGAAVRVTRSRARTAVPPRPYVLETPVSVTAADASVTAVVLIALSAHRRLGGGGEQRAGRTKIEDAGQVDRLEQPDADGLPRVLGQRCRVRVDGERDLLERGAEHLGLERLAGVGGKLVVGGRRGRGGIGLDVVDRLDVRLQ